MNADLGRPVLFDMICGKPIGWRKMGEPIIAEEWHPDGGVVLTAVLTPAQAVELYGPVTSITVGPGWGWRNATYGTTTFGSRRLDPRDTDYAKDARIEVEDPDLEVPCPKCEAAPCQPCEGASKHRARRWHPIEQAQDNRNMALQQEVERLEAEVESLRDWADQLRRSIEQPWPRCNRPTSAGTPCKARAIEFPTPIESCRVHLTVEERDHVL